MGVSNYKVMSDSNVITRVKEKLSMIDSIINENEN
jgi:hypothetical protein